MRYFVTVGDREVEVDLSGPQPRVDGVVVRAELSGSSGTPVRHLLVDGRSHAFVAEAGERRGGWRLSFGSARFRVDAVDERTRAIREMTGDLEDEGDKTILAPMPGLVVQVAVEVGDRVRAGQGVVIVEAMKMENELKAPTDGVVASIEVTAGETVNKGATLIVLE